MTADQLRARLRAFDLELEMLAASWKAAGEQIPRPHDRLNAIFAEHRAVRLRRRAVENQLAALGREQVLAPRDRYPRQGFHLSAATFPWEATMAMRAALSP